MQLALALSERYPERISLRNQMLAAWCKDDPEAAIVYSQGLPEKARLSALAALIGTMAKDYSDQALSVALGLVDEKQREKALFAILPEAIKSDPDTVEKHSLTLPEGNPRYELMRTLAKERAERDPVAAMAWAKRQDDLGERGSRQLSKSCRLILSMSELSGCKRWVWRKRFPTCEKGLARSVRVAVVPGFLVAAIYVIL